MWVLFRGGEEGILVLNCTIPSVPGEIPNLKVENRNITAEQASAVAEEVFNLVGSVRRIEDAYLVENEARLFVIFDQGGFLYDHGPYGGNSPSGETAKQVAGELLGKLRDNGLTPSHPSVEIENADPSIDSAVRVTFPIKFENISIGEIAIDVGEGGEVVQARGDWKEVIPEENISIMTPKEELDILPEKLTQHLEEELERYGVPGYPSITKIIVQNIAPPTYFVTLTAPQDYLLPIYLFEFKIEWSSKHPVYDDSNLIYSVALSAIDGGYVYGTSLTGIA